MFAERCGELAAAGFDATLEAELDRYRARMNDISEFMKTVKELFAIWFNREFDYCGSVWSGVFKSTMVEGGIYLARCRRHRVPADCWRRPCRESIQRMALRKQSC